MGIYHSYRRYLTDRFAKPVFRIPVNGGFSCPNRDGTTGSHGCAFCDNRAFSPAALSAEDVCMQITRSISRYARQDAAFIAYLQPFSNTYAPLTVLKEIYEPILQIPGVVGLAIGTRPDCLPADVLDYLAALNQRTDLCVEIGLQSGHDATLSAIQRGHTVQQFKDAVTSLHSRGIYCAAHVILGLPGETRDMMAATARLLADLPVNGVKIHQLMIVEGTRFQQLFEAGELAPPAIENYADWLGLFLTLLRKDQHIHRIMADSSEANGLIAPLWSADKSASISYLQKKLTSLGITQGSGR